MRGPERLSRLGVHQFTEIPSLNGMSMASEPISSEPCLFLSHNFPLTGFELHAQLFALLVGVEV